MIIVETTNKTDKEKSGFFHILDCHVTFEFLSGPWGHGALPDGLYLMDKCYELKEDKSTLPYKGESIAWVANLIPQFETDRTDLYCHGVGERRGTKGCIEIIRYDLACFSYLRSLVNHQKKIKVVVL